MFCVPSVARRTRYGEYLEAELKNTDLGEYVSQVLIPTEKTFTVRNGKKVMKERAYLPGYVLVEAALVGEVAHRLRNIPNVIGFLGGSDTPVPLRPAEVNRILGTVDELQEQRRGSGYPVLCWRECEDYFWTVQRFHGYNRRGQRREKET